VGDRLRLGLPDVVPLTDLDRDPDVVADQENDARADAVCETVLVMEPEDEREREGEPEPVVLTDPERLCVGLTVLVVVLEAAERVAVIVRVAVVEGDPETVGEPVVLGEPDVLWDPLVLTDPLEDAVVLCDALVLAVVEGDPVVLPVKLTDTVGVCVPVALTEVDTVAVAEGVAGMQAPGGKVFSTGPAAA